MFHLRLIALPLLAIAAAACGGSNDAAPATTAATAGEADSTTTLATTAPTTVADTAPPTTVADTAPPTTVADESSTADAESVMIDGIDEMPSECVDLMKELLIGIEPFVEGTDIAAMTSADFDSMMGELESEFADMETKVSELGCDRYEFANPELETQAMLDIAAEHAPGAVEWLEFISNFGTEATGEAAPGVDGPTDCESAIAYLEGLIAEGKKVSDIPLGELNLVTQSMSVISADCTPERTAEFFGRTDVAVFAGG